ncbi:MAG: cysteine--tRNA ligase [Candidatus Rokubacteria bacterium]|nr:cysteine--tRNA ligase [Candidatus Rokubacteria bacterium]
MKIYNTLTRTKEEFAPLRPGQIRMYVCGVTVYDLSHIGHARSAIVFDVIYRYLTFKGYRVTFVKNFTDVDDKIIKRAQEEGVEAPVISERYIDAFREDMRAVGVLPADEEPKATDHIPQMVGLVERLVAKGFAYVVDGDVYFEVRRFAGYGKLSGKNLDELLAGARVEVDERKRDPRDFALWKSAKPGEPSWPSPWGPGRPGWHIECSAMAMKYLGESFDIHGGGEDLIFPHHECEIAQSEADTGQPFARYWIHNGFVNLGKEKMSKSLGNTLTIREMAKRHDPDALRLWLLGTHYRSLVEFSEEHVQGAARALRRLTALVQSTDHGHDSLQEMRPGGRLEKTFAGLAEMNELKAEESLCEERFVQSMDDDFNTPAALGALFEFSHALQGYRADPARPKGAFERGVATLLRLANTLGMSLKPHEGAQAPAGELRRRIEVLIGQRERARGQRDWKTADTLRKELREIGVTVEDTPIGPKWTWNPSDK